MNRKLISVESSWTKQTKIPNQIKFFCSVQLDKFFFNRTNSPKRTTWTVFKTRFDCQHKTNRIRRLQTRFIGDRCVLAGVKSTVVLLSLSLSSPSSHHGGTREQERTNSSLHGFRHQRRCLPSRCNLSLRISLVKLGFS